MTSQAEEGTHIRKPGFSQANNHLQTLSSPNQTLTGALALSPLIHTSNFIPVLSQAEPGPQAYTTSLAQL